MKEFRKRNRYYLFLLVRIAINIFFRFSPFIFGIRASVIFLLCGALLLFYYDKLVNAKSTRKAQLEFLCCFRNGAYEQKGAKEIYDSACHFIRGYQEIIPYSELLEDPSRRKSPEDYQEYFLAIRELDKKGELHLPDYRPLLEKIEEETTEREKGRRKRNQDFLLSLLLIRGSVFVLSRLRILVPSFSSRLNGTIPSRLLLAFPFLSISLTLLYLIREEKKHV